MKIGVFGGTFNPIHNGHISLLHKMKQEMELDKVLLVPTFMPPHKSGDEVVSALHRLEMCRLAVQELDWVQVSDIEVMRGGTSYTVDTLRAISKTHPNDELFLLMGSDMFFSFEQWKSPNEIASLARIEIGRAHV